MNEKRIELMESAPIPKVMKSLGFPAIIGMLVGAIYNLVDTLFIGMLNDTAALGAATILFPVFMLISAIGLTFGMGAASAISIKLGEKDREGASVIGSTANFSVVLVGILFSLLGIIFIEPLLRLFGATDSILHAAKRYGIVIIAGSVFQMINMTMNNMIRAEGAAKISGIAIALGAILNIILDPVFMFLFDMGLSGAAVATVIAQAISTVFLLSFYIRGKSALHLSFRKIHPGLEIYKRIMSIGIPTLFRQVLTSFAMAMLNNAAANFGDGAIAAIGITFRIIMLPMFVLFGFSQGFQPLAGYSYGAKNFIRLKESVKYAVSWTTKFATVATLICFLGATYIISFFTDDSEVIRSGTIAMRSIVISFPFMGFQLIYSFLYQAMGRGKPTMLLAVARQGILFIPAVLILPKIFGLYGVYAAQPAADILTVVITAILAVRVNKELHTKQGA